MTTIIFKIEDWVKFTPKLYAGHPLSARLSWKHKEVFDFTVRVHQGIEIATDGAGTKYSRQVDKVHLDFVDEAAATLFKLRWT